MYFVILFCEWYNCIYKGQNPKKKNKNHHLQYYLGTVMIQFSSVTQSCPTLCNPTNPCTPGLPVYHQLPEFTQTHVH